MSFTPNRLGVLIKVEEGVLVPVSVYFYLSVTYGYWSTSRMRKTFLRHSISTRVFKTTLMLPEDVRERVEEWT